MDRDRYKRRIHTTLPKRSINSEERPLRVAPVIISPIISDFEPFDRPESPNTAAQVVYKSPAHTAPQQARQIEAPVTTHTLPQQVSQPNQPDKPLLFDEDDEDIFGVWKNQKEIKKAEKAKMLATKEAKKAAKIAKRQAAKTAKEQGSPREIAVKLSVPRVSKVKSRLKRAYKKEYKKQYIIGASLLALPILAISSGAAIHTFNKPSGKTDVLGQKVVVAKPDFSTLRPTTTDNQATDIKYDAEKKVAGYNDVLNNIPITVSQQPLPSDFKASPTTSVENLAKQMNANDKISASDTTAFAGVSIKGPQTVVFTKNDLLIFIIADKKIDVLAWSKYIENMR